MGKLIFKAYKKTDNFLYKMVKNYYKKKQRKASKKGS